MRQLENGLSERTLAFEPGFEVYGEEVCRTFQPSYVVTRDGVLIAFCQGRLRGGRDDDPKVILTSKSSDWGATWSPAKAVSGRITHYAVSAYLSERDGRERVSVLSMVDLRGTENIYDKDYGEMRAQSGIDIDAVGRDTPMVLCRFDSDDDGDTWTMEMLLGDRSPLNHRYSDGTLIMFNAVGQVHAISEGPIGGGTFWGDLLLWCPRERPLRIIFATIPSPVLPLFIAMTRVRPGAWMVLLRIIWLTKLPLCRLTAVRNCCSSAG